MKLLRRTGVALAVLLVLCAVPGLFMTAACRGDRTLSSVTRARILEAPPADARGVEVSYLRDEARTYLTFPEWFIVYVSQDYGAFLRNNEPSGFPYFSSVFDFWSSYCGVTRVTTARYPMNWGAHVMIYVIGVSHSLEYAVKGLYENTVGRLFEVLAFGADTEEEDYAGAVARDYGAFLNTTPWYEYPFAEKLQGLWTDTGFTGDGIMRKWERKIVLTLEYGFKAAYGALIAGATGAAYAPAELEIMLVTSAVPDAVLDARREIERVAVLDDGSYLLQVPRYEAFTRTLQILADADVDIEEIAGNGEILVTAVMPPGTASAVEHGEQMFSMGLAVASDLDRVGYRVAVRVLKQAIEEIESAGGTFEHAYDY